MKEGTKRIKVNEIYYTFSGEGKTKGLPVVIVRLTGCNLRCSFCDSKWAYKEGKIMTFNKIASEISKYRYCKRVLLSGGEPLQSPNCFDLVKFINKELDKDIILETNGSLSIYKYIPYISVVCMDVKCPFSGMEKGMCWTNFYYLRPCDEIKFIIGDREDYDYAKMVILKYNSQTIKQEQYVFSPVWGKMDPKTLAEWILKDQLDVRYSLQMHKIIWDKDKRGV